jgi:hypothetical protein
MVSVIEPAKEVDTIAINCRVSRSNVNPTTPNSLSIHWISFLEFLKYSNFNSAGITVLLDGSDYFDSNPFIFVCIDGFHHLAESTLSQ